jgi:hypothetical protein
MQKGDARIMHAMDHFRIDAGKYERSVTEARSKADRVGELLEAIGSLGAATRAVREAVADGRIPDELLGILQSLVKTIAAQRAPDTVNRPEQAVGVDHGLPDELVELLLQIVHLMQFSNFVIQPGGSPEVPP